MRECMRCGKAYNRRNLAEAWVKTNVGHRTGWQKAVIKVCTHCMNPNQAMRMFLVANIRVLPGRTEPKVHAVK